MLTHMWMNGSDHVSACAFEALLLGTPINSPGTGKAVAERQSIALATDKTIAAVLLAHLHFCSDIASSWSLERTLAPIAKSPQGPHGPRQSADCHHRRRRPEQQHRHARCLPSQQDLFEVDTLLAPDCRQRCRLVCCRGSTEQPLGSDGVGGVSAAVAGTSGWTS